MLDIILSVQGAIAGRAESLVRRGAWAWRSALLAVVLIGACGAALEEAAQGEAAQGEAAQGEAAQGEAARGEHEPGPPAAIDGFRQARFGMAEEQVRQAIRKDFPAAAGKVASAIHPSEKTTVLTVTVPDLLPHSGNARISYILGHRSKKLGQVNIVWSSDGSTAGDEAIVGTANSLRDYFSLEHFKPDSIVANHQLAPNAILVFRASDEQNRNVLLVLSGAAAGARAEDKKAPKPPPLTLELSYIEDPAHPDVFRIGKGQF
jgi:hypothetical protein